jgi:hypothetical protein
MDFKKVHDIAGHQWLTLVILATWKAEIRRIIFKASQGIVHETLFPKYPTQKRAGRVARGRVPS